MLDQLDYVYLVSGFSCVLLGIGSLKMAGGPIREACWRWLAAFGFLHGVHEWLETAGLDTGDSPGFRAVRLTVMAASFVALLEFGRRSRRAGGNWAPGWWVCLVLGGLAGMGGLTGLSGLNVCCRYALGLPGGLVGGWVLWQTAGRRSSGAGRWSLGMAGAALMLYGLAAAMSSAPSLRTLLALAAAGGLFAEQRLRPGVNRPHEFRPVLVAAVLVLLLIGGWWTADWRERKADARMRERILSQATEIAETIGPQQVRMLSFTAADKDKPVFQRLRRQLIAYGQAIGQRSIYSIALRNGTIVFGPESLDEADPQASPPGTVYEQPTQRNWESLRTGESFTEGPSTDEYGTFVSGFAPVRDPRTHEVLMMVGLDIQAGDWVAQMARQRLVAIAFTLVLAVLLLGGSSFLEWHEKSGPCQGWLRYGEAFLIAGCGLVLTAAGALAAHDEETCSRRLMFSQVADAHATGLAQVMRELRDLQLDGLARFYESNENVTRGEFRLYVGPLVNDAAVRAFEWAPRVPAADKEKIEALAHQEGFDGFTIFQRDERGNKVPAAGRDEFYPVFHVEPVAGNEPAVGFDLSSEPIRRAALEEAAKTGLPAATDPINLVQEKGHRKGILVFQPVFERLTGAETNRTSDVQIGPPRGFALVVLHLQSALNKALADCDERNPIIQVELYQLQAGQQAQWLASWPETRDDEAGTFAAGQPSDLSVVSPLFICGKAYVAVVHPGPAFLTAHPARAGGQVGLVGLVLTLVMSGGVGFARYRRAALEREVLARTAKLEEIHRAKEAIQREEARAKILLKLNQLTAGQPEMEIAGQALEAGIRLTGSKIGYIAFVSEDETVLNMAYWSKSAMSECAIQDKPIVYPLKNAGLWGEVLRQREPVITNDYAAPNKFKKGTPPGHVKVIRHMGVPVFDGDKIVVVAGVGNKGDDYTGDDAIELMLLMDGMWRIVCRKRAEEALRDSEERHRVLYESSADAIMTIAPPSWKFTAMNPAGVRLFGAKNEDEFLALNPGDVSPEYQPDGQLSSAKAAEMIGTAMRKGSHFFEWTHRRLNGEEFAATVLLARVDLGGQSLIQATVRDITAQRRAEALEQEKTSLKQAVASMEQVLGVVGHELRTPLAGVRAMSEFLLLPGVEQTAEYAKFLKSINTEVVRMAEMVNDMLEAARLSSGTARWNWSPFRLLDPCQDAIETVRPLVDPDAVALYLIVEPPDMAMRGDRAAVRRLILNLLSNACKYTPSGYVSVQTRFSCDQQGAWIEIRVQDTGEGMSAEIAAKLGEAFALNSGVVGDRCVKGSGLGLAICRGIVGAHGGSMEMQSALGEGTTITVRLRADLTEPMVSREPIEIVRSIKA